MFFFQLCHFIHYLLTRGGRGGALEDLTDSLRQADRSSAILISSSCPLSVHSLMFSIQCFLCRPLFLDPSTVPWRMVLEMVWWRVTWPNHASFLLLTIAISSSCFPILWAIESFTESLVLLSFQDMPRRRRKHLISNALILFSRSAVSVQLSQP